MSQRPISDWVDSAPPDITTRQAVELALEHYGLRARPTPLYAERDRNFRLDLADGSHALLKISNPDADPATVAFQVRALRHALQADPELPIPRVLDSLEGRAIVPWAVPGGNTLLIRLLSWLPGRPLGFTEVAPPAAQFDAGRCLARLGRALSGCNADGAPRDLPWDMSNLGALRQLRGTFDDRWVLETAAKLLDEFDTVLAARLAALPAQVIHNDLNPDNMLFDPADPDRLAGIIDFGDMVVGPLVCDLAVGCAYQLGDGPDPLADLVPMTSGYCSIMPLGSNELALLPKLVKCRLLATLLIQGSRAIEAGEDWRATHRASGQAAIQLRRLDGIDHAAAARRLIESCTGNAPPP